MSFVTLTVYKLDNLRNQLMNNRLLFPRFIAFASCQDRVGRPMQPVLQMDRSILSKSEVLTTKLTLSGMDDRFGRKKKRLSPFGRTDAYSLIRLASSDNIVESPWTLLRGRRVQWASRNS